MPAPKKYPDEVRERAVRMVFEIRQETGQQQGAIARVADKLSSVNRETLRNWVRQAEVDGGKRSDTSTVDAQRIATLWRESRELEAPSEQRTDHVLGGERRPTDDQVTDIVTAARKDRRHHGGPDLVSQAVS